MNKRHFKFAVMAVAGLSLLPGCTSRDKTAAAAAAEADAEFQQGRFVEARVSIREAIAARDDVSDYWLLLARIQMATDNFAGAFEAYQNVIQFDRGNIEALRLLCQLGLTVRRPDQVDKYADQLLLLSPDDPMPLTMKGGAALQRADTATAISYADRVLAKNPQDVSALTLKSRVFVSQRKYAEATKLMEDSITAGSDPAPRLVFLVDLYTKAGDRNGYQRALQRLAMARPKDVPIQLNYADMLYQTGQPDAARSALLRVMNEKPRDLGVSAQVLDIWLKEGPHALDPSTMVADSAGLSNEMKSAYAQFANEIGRPDIAIAVLGSDRPEAPPTAGNSNVKASFALALGLSGKRADALGRLDRILSADPSQPRALLARARLLAAGGDTKGAAAAARSVISDDPRNVTARLFLVDLLLAGPDPQLGEGVLRDGVRDMPNEARLAARLAKLLYATGRKDEAILVLRDLTASAPVSLRAERLRLTMDPTSRLAIPTT